MKKNNVMIVGAGGVAHVAAHKCAQNNDVLGDLCIATRRVEKAERIIASIHAKKNSKNPSPHLKNHALKLIDRSGVTKKDKSSKR